MAITTLSRAWDKVNYNQGACGGDGVTVGRFAQSATQRIKRLAHELRSGSYTPGPARRVFIPKPKGGFRPLDIPCVADRVVQAATTLILDPILDREMEPSSYAYRRGRSVAQAVARVAALRRDGYRHVVDGDIVRYFERIPHEALILRLETLIDDRELVDLIWLWLEAYAPSGLGVPQGSPLSPLLANLYLDSVDEQIEGRGVRLVRFADDFLLLCKSETLAETALARMRQLLIRHGLELHADKTRLVDFDQGFRFLGHMFVRSMIFKEVDDDETPTEDVIAAAEALTAGMGAAKPVAFDDANAASGGRAPRLRPLYVLEPGRRLEALGETLRVVGDDAGLVLALPPGRLGRIELGPDTDATLAAFDVALGHGVEVVRINGHGETVARYEAPLHDRARRHLAQAAHQLDPGKRAVLARLIVEGRVRNQRALLRRLNRERALGEVVKACQGLGRVLRKLEGVSEVAVAMGHEGEAARLYWPALGLCLPPTFEFKVRRRRPAPDPVNMALSVISNLLARDIRSMAVRAGLHPGFAVLHAVDDGEDALVFDLIEEFRAPVAEAATLALFNRRALRPEHFLDDTGRIRLARDAWKALIRGYEAWVCRPIKSPRTGEKILWRGLMLEQAHAYGAHCEGGATYQPYVLDH